MKLTEAMAFGQNEMRLKEFYNLSAKIEKLTNELKELEKQQGGLKEELIAELEKTQDNTLEIENLILKIKRKGYERTSYAYKEAFTWLFERVNPAMKKIAEEALQATQKMQQVAPSLSISRTDPITEGVWDKLKGLFKSILNKIRGYNDTIEYAIDEAKNRLTEDKGTKLISLRLIAEEAHKIIEFRKKHV